MFFAFTLIKKRKIVYLMLSFHEFCFVPQLYLLKLSIVVKNELNHIAPNPSTSIGHLLVPGHVGHNCRVVGQVCAGLGTYCT